MRTIETVSELKKFVREAKRANRSIGFVPTMGFLHEGHLSLTETARQENDAVIMSIFVNPAQFGPNEDFERYPRNLERDSALAREAGADVLFIPPVEEVYPHEMQTVIKAGSQADSLCGKSRPGHFDGVLKVVTKLFHMTEADRAYFGKKDAQQLAIIETLVTDFNFPVEIRRGETIREPDGLAKSSRNVYLSPAERQEAAALYQALLLGEQAVKSGRDPVSAAASHLTASVSGSIDYVEYLSYPQLRNEPADEMILAVAVQFEKARLIDNIIISKKGN